MHIHLRLSREGMPFTRQAVLPPALPELRLCHERAGGKQACAWPSGRWQVLRLRHPSGPDARSRSWHPAVSTAAMHGLHLQVRSDAAAVTAL